MSIIGHAGIATVDAIRDADNPWIFTDLKDDGLEAWKADRLLINGAERQSMLWP